MSNPNKPDLRVRVPSQEAFRGRQHILSQLKRAGFYINGDDLSAVAWLDQSSYLLFVDLRAAPGMLIFAETRLSNGHSIPPLP
jgi:hypothetical protein